MTQAQGGERIVAQLPLGKKVVLSLIPLVVLAGLAEIVFRLLPNPHDVDETVSGLAVPDPDLVWRLRSFESGPLRTNELGLRDHPLRPDVDVRILLLGDSVAWGDGVPVMEAIFPQVAERILDEQVPGKSIEVVNSAVLGYSTFQQRRYLELRGLDLDPDIVVLQFCLNDVVERYSRLAAYGGDNVFLGVDTRSAIPGIFGWMVRRSRAFEAMARAAIRLSRDGQEYDVRRMAEGPSSPELEEAWEETLSEIDRIRGIVDKRGIPLLLLIAPYRFQLDDPGCLDGPQRRLIAWSLDRELPTLDLLPVFTRRAGGAGVPLFRDESHFTIDGHDLAGRSMAAAVLTMMRQRSMLD